ncbi:hypothetical protein H5U98_02790 [Mycolicibacterium boenickei]|uniref:Integral membrane protein n=2 Tax=Mycolicibacterium boenickei TaxID=146017 RepID=A0AAX3A622_9MYCO|nr:hypothetical protein [Mycolicibacterium boenickei]PEG61855.1 hypothetical protein CQY21_05970 [Mycolicibacterium boenickei]UNC02749.1 hypothetical protein H5U98_02790 [Mycolicibacterium boenickei]
MSFRRARSVMSAEIAAIRRTDPDLDAGDIAGFTLPILVRALGVVAIGLVPLLVVRNGETANEQLVPVIGSLALVIICAAVVAWLISIVISGLVVMILYRTRPASSSRLVMRILTDSFMRIDDSTSALMLLALLAGLLSLAFGLPTRSGDELANSVLDDLLAAQIGVLLVALGFAFVAESIRSAADIVDDQSLLLAWPWALIIASLSWVLATVVGPFEATRMLTILLHEWLPAVVDDRPSAQVIAELVPPSARWWVAFGPLPIIAAIWAYEAYRRGGFIAIRRFFEDDGPSVPDAPRDSDEPAG